MPNVKGKQYPYTPAGMLAASKARRGLNERSPFPVRPGNSINQRGVRPSNGPGLPPPDPRLLRPQPRRGGGLPPQRPLVGPGMGPRPRLSKPRPVGPRPVRPGMPNPFRKKGSGGSRQMSTPGMGNMLKGKGRGY